MKIALAQLNYHVGNFESNTTKIIEHINEARDNGADLVVFAELCVCGYPSRDFLEFDEFIDLCDDAAKKIAAACTGMACIIGIPTFNHKAEGKDLSNSASPKIVHVCMFAHKKALNPGLRIGGSYEDRRYWWEWADWNKACEEAE